MSFPVQQLQSPRATKPEKMSTDQTLLYQSRHSTVVGKISGEARCKYWPRRGRASGVDLLIDEGAKVEGEVVAEELTIGGRVKGTIHANRVKLNSTAVVEGDIFHRSLSIEENARFEGSSRREDNAGEMPAHLILANSAAHDDLQTKVAGHRGQSEIQWGTKP